MWRLAMAVAFAGACGNAPSARERALAQLPGDRLWVAAADGRALADPAFRGAIDAARSRVPPSLGCVIDLALHADAVAVASDGDASTTVVVVGGAPPGDCPALARVAPDVWIAATADASGPSVVDDPRWARARRYLVDAPFALAADLGDRHVVAALRPDPRDGWIAIDSTDPAAAERELRALLASSSAVVQRADRQVIARLVDVDLGEVVARVLRARDAAPPRAFRCPPPDGVVIACDGATVRVSSFDAVFARVRTVTLETAVDNGDAIGARLGAPAAPFDRDDVLETIDGHRVDRLGDVSLLRRASVVFRRGATDITIELVASE